MCIQLSAMPSRVVMQQEGLPAVDLRISGACSDAKMVRTVCSSALSAMLVASAMVMAEPPTALDNTSCRQLSNNVSQLWGKSWDMQDGCRRAGEEGGGGWEQVEVCNCPASGLLL